MARRRGIMAKLTSGSLPQPLGAWSFDDTPEDSSGNGLTATVTAYTTGHTNDGAVGDASHAAASYSGALIASPTAVSFMFWFYPTRTSAGGLDGNITFLSIDSTGAPGYLVVAWSNSTHLVAQFTNAAGTDYSAVASVTTAQNTWVHVAATWVSGTLLLYLNGVQVGTATTSGVLPTLSWLEAGGLAAASAFNLGVVDDLRVFDTALSSTDITTYMNTPVPPPSGTPTIATYGTPASTAAGNTVTLDDPAGVVAGSLVLAMVTMGAANGGSFASTNLTATGWLNCGFYTYFDIPDGNNIGVWWMYKYATGGPVTGQVFTTSNAGGIISFGTGITMLIDDGPTSGNPAVDTLQANNATPAASSLSIPSVTPGGDNSLLIAQTAAQWQGASGSQPSGWTRLSGGWFNPSNGPQFAIDTLEQETAAPTGTLTWTFSPAVDAVQTTILTIRA